jgi:hypothetical protein
MPFELHIAPNFQFGLSFAPIVGGPDAQWSWRDSVDAAGVLHEPRTYGTNNRAQERPNLE